jgi:hypothetical protein
MNGDDRMRFVLPISAAGFLGAFLLLRGLYTYLVLTKKQILEAGALIFFAAFFSPIALWIVFRIGQIIRSIRRYNNRGNISVA